MFPQSLNTTMDKLAVGALFRYGHNRDDNGLVFEKVSNSLSRDLRDQRLYSNDYNNEPAGELKVSCVGSTRTLATGLKCESDQPSFSLRERSPS